MAILVIVKLKVKSTAAYPLFQNLRSRSWGRQTPILMTGKDQRIHREAPPVVERLLGQVPAHRLPRIPGVIKLVQHQVGRTPMEENRRKFES